MEQRKDINQQPSGKFRTWFAVGLGVSLLGWGMGLLPAIAQSQAPIPPDPGPIPTTRVSRPTLTLDSQGEAVAELQAVLTLLGFYAGPITSQYEATTQAAVKNFQTTVGLVADGVVGPATWSELFPAPPQEAMPPSQTPSASSSSPATSPSAGTSSGSSEPANSGTSSSSTTNTGDSGSSGSSGNSGSSTATPTPATTPPANLPVLKVGAEGADVVTLQEKLKALGFYQGVVDGIFGSQTEQAVIAAQRANGLETDGIVGPATWRALWR